MDRADQLNTRHVRGAFGAAITGGQAILLSTADLSAWASGIWGQISDALLGGSKEVIGPGGLGGNVATSQSISSQIIDAIIPDFTGVKLPDIGATVGNWVAAQIAVIKSSLDVVPQWMKDLANGDVLAAVKDIFGSGSGSGSTTGTTVNADGTVTVGPIDINLDDPSIPVEKKDKFLNIGTGLGETIGDGIVVGLGNRKTQVGQAIRDLVTPPTTDTNDSKTTSLKPQVIPAPDTSAVIRALGDAATATKNATTGIIATVAGLVAPLTQGGTQAALGFAAGIANGMRIAIQAAATGAASVVAAVRANLRSLGPGRIQRRAITRLRYRVRYRRA
jgi:hypothetical protein